MFIPVVSSLLNVNLTDSMLAAVSDALQKELGAPKQFAENVQSMMFPLHMKTALEIADDFEWTKELPGTTVVKDI